MMVIFVTPAIALIIEDITALLARLIQLMRSPLLEKNQPDEEQTG